MTSNDLTKLSFNAVPRAMAALELASERTGDNRTDTANRALQLYAAILATEVGHEISFQDRDGTTIRFMRLPDEP